jgi:hypothetical protein
MGTLVAGGVANRIVHRHCDGASVCNTPEHNLAKVDQTRFVNN